MDTPSSEHTLPYEETPIIEPIPTSGVKEVSTPEVLSPPKHQGHASFLHSVATAILFIVLFFVGVGASMILREFFSSSTIPAAQPGTATPTPSTSGVKEVSTPEVNLTPTLFADPYAGWNTTQAISGATKQPVAGISFKLPAEVLSPICDGASCASQGTYLSNGSRFTVAPRGEGQLLVDARGAIVVTDSSGKSFTTKQVTLAGERIALEYTGLFSGTTVGGYTFSQMRGVMIEIDDNETLEMNHFTPSGVNADFVKDDALFDKIVTSLTVSRFPQATTSATGR